MSSPVSSPVDAQSAHSIDRAERRWLEQARDRLRRPRALQPREARPATEREQ